MSQKIVGNFVVGTVYSCDEQGQWTGTWLVRRYGVNNGRIIATRSAPGVFATCKEAADQAMQQGEEFAKSLDPDSGGSGSMPGSGDELFIPPTAAAQREPTRAAG
jgi:hypothetical protein